MITEREAVARGRAVVTELLRVTRWCDACRGVPGVPHTIQIGGSHEHQRIVHYEIPKLERRVDAIIGKLAARGITIPERTAT